MSPRRATGFVALTLLASVVAGAAPAAGPAGLQITQPSAQPDRVTVVIRSQHRRLTFQDNIRRIAVADTEILSAELITSREVLVLGRETGRTTLLVWFEDGTFEERVFSVARDLSVLERALRLVHPSITVESAPDRDALVLTGRVPDVVTSQTAEGIARNYLDAGSRGSTTQPYIGAQPAADPAATPSPAAPPAAGQPVPAAQPPAQVGPGAAIQLQGAVPPSGTIINLIQLETLPPLPEEKILDAIRPLGGQSVTARRALRGDVRDDTRDTLVLEGTVANQVALVRVLTVAAQLFAGQTIAAEDIRVIADEAGALADQAQGQGQGQAGQSQSLGGGATSSLFGGARGSRLTNQVRTNLGRAKAIEVARGRILSFIGVSDLPQVRVDIRLVEVNRTKLRAFDPNAALLLSDFRQPSLNPAQSATAVQGDQAARVGSLGPAIQNVLSFLSGGLLNQFQYAGSHVGIDGALSLLEREGIARSLSAPSLTVLSGESAQVQIGGEVPVPTAFAPAFGGAVGGGTTPGVFSSVEFVPFGVQLQIRPLVGDDDTITLDLQPLVVTPDALLTDTIRQATGTAVPTTAFQTRALRTSSRLQDGQALLIGGLISNNTSANSSSTPGLRSVPVLGRLFQGFNRNDQATELIVIVNPVVLRTPLSAVSLWEFPSRDELLRSTLSRLSPPVKP
ncbi:MAG: pilus assembly protein N-terminal domain-containing protein [Acidobacteriota bacterium]